jgi:putative ABC transport system permease protein
MRTLLQDLRYAVRLLIKAPAYTAVAILTLALGIGANTAIFSVVEAVLLRPLPYKDSSRLVLVGDRQGPENGGVLYKDFAAYRSRSHSFESLAIYYRDSGFARVTLSAGGEPESVQGAFVSADFFDTMGIPPLLGRTFTFDEEQREEHILLLGYGLWLRRFGGSPDSIGKNLQINGAAWKIIGVMPATFQFPARDEQFWAPMTTNSFWHDSALSATITPNHTASFYRRWIVVGRLKHNVSVQQAQAESQTLFASIALADPDTNRTALGVFPLAINLRASTRLALYVLLGAVSFVLLIACSNVANLVLARGAGRIREMAVRAALGAGRARLVQQLLTESALLALVAGGVGLFLASTGIRSLILFGPADIPRLEEAHIDTSVLLFTLTLSLVAATIFGLVPAWRIPRNDPHEALKTARMGAPASGLFSRARSFLVAVELALAVVLVMGAGLLVRSFLAIQAVDLGFNPQNVLTMKLTTPASFTPERKTAFHREALDRIAAFPNVRAVGAISGLFELGEATNLGLRAVEGHAAERPENWTPLIWKSVSGNYFAAMGTALLRGRDFANQDGLDSPLVAVIDESAARRYWPGEDPIGKRFKGQDPRGRNDDWIAVIGVVRDMRRNGLERAPLPHVFEWYNQQRAGAPSDLVIRTNGIRGWLL